MCVHKIVLTRLFLFFFSSKWFQFQQLSAKGKEKNRNRKYRENLKTKFDKMKQEDKAILTWLEINPREMKKEKILSQKEPKIATSTKKIWIHNMTKSYMSNKQSKTLPSKEPRKKREVVKKHIGLNQNLGCFALLMWSFHNKHLPMFVLMCAIKTSFLL